MAGEKVLETGRRMWLCGYGLETREINGRVRLDVPAGNQSLAGSEWLESSEAMIKLIISILR